MGWRFVEIVDGLLSISLLRNRNTTRIARRGCSSRSFGSAHNDSSWMWFVEVACGKLDGKLCVVIGMRSLFRRDDKLQLKTEIGKTATLAATGNCN